MALSLPPIGLETSRNDDSKECTVTITVLETGHRRVDTAQRCGSETVAGEGLERADAPHKECIVATGIALKRLDGTDGERIDRERRLIDREDAPW